eukprot:CAMPEP_0182466964 /NCGR_PEP_ID=MMETSP1319-20130603/12981_1 /TAXON_ID=172717 /ORGANISM="Bolidomonas pacifica, Strain RCC208" /LENGTH=296 /DNA_ID=CAMNT_0024667011 /DNA_START=173 /DNA_END=1060 /DNA_ORIENTATION=-
MPRPEFSTRLASPQSSLGFSAPPPLQTRTGKLGRLNHLKNLKGIIDDLTPSRSKPPPRPRHVCAVCGAAFRTGDGKDKHERACRMLSAGEAKARRSVGAAPKPRRRKEGGKDRYDDDNKDEDDSLERLLRSTAAFALNFKDGPEVGSASVPRPGDFSSNFSTNQYVRARAAARRAAEDREAGEAGRRASALEEEARARRREEERAARLRTFECGRHEAEWSRFLNRSLGKRALTLKDLPLIPPEQYGSLPEVLGREDMRRLLVRWHPDKFEAAFSSKFEPGVREEVMERVRGLCRA